MAKKIKAPSGDYIKDMATILERKYANRNQRVANTRDHRFSRTVPQIPDAYRKTVTAFRSPFIFDMIRRCVAIMGNDFPQPKVIPLKVTQKAQENSSLREEWLMQAYAKMGKKVYQQLIDSLAADGTAVLKVYLDKHAWGAVGLRQENEDAEPYLERVQTERRKVFPYVVVYLPPVSTSGGR